MRRNSLKTFVILLIFELCFFTTLSSNAQELDTLGLVKKLNEQRDFKMSSSLLESYYPNHPNDLYAGWLYAISLHQIKKFKRSRGIYTRTIQLFPDNIDLILDYVSKLSEEGKLEEAVNLLNTLGDSLPKDYLYSVKKTLAQIYYWEGEYDKALAEVNMSLALYSTMQEAVDLKSEILLAKSNWIVIDADYSEDDQPLKIITPTIETIFYKNSSLSAGLKLNSPIILKADELYTSQWLNGMVKYQFLGSKIELKLTAGIIKFPSQDFDWTAAFQVKKVFLNHLKFGIGAERKPYLSTEAAIDKKVMQTTYGTFLSWNDPHGWTGHASFDLNRFSAFDNQYYTVSAWLLTPKLNLSVFIFRLGYGYNFSDSKENTYVSKYSLDEIISNWDSTAVIQGVYDPFFSPNKQSIHTAILIITINPTKKIGITLNTSYGFLATAKTPYLYLNEDEDEEPYIERQFYDDNYHPIQFTANVSYLITPKFTLNAYYTYSSTNFYISQLVGLKTIIRF